MPACCSIRWPSSTSCTRATSRCCRELAFTGNAVYSFKTARDSVALKFTNFEPDSAAGIAGGQRRQGGLLRGKKDQPDESL